MKSKINKETSELPTIREKRGLIKHRLWMLVSSERMTEDVIPCADEIISLMENVCKKCKKH